MNKKEKKELIEYTRGVRGKDWQPLSIPKTKVYQLKTKPGRTKVKEESRKIIRESYDQK